jgi:hypothetical protein
VRTLPKHREIVDQVRMILGVLGVYLIIFGAVAAVWSIRSTIAQFEYAAILNKPADPGVKLDRARRSFRFYSKNYSLCIRAAKIAFTEAEAARTPEDTDSHMRLADYWVSRGLELNPWLIELRHMKAKLLARQVSPEAGMRSWQEYVDWHFWDPRNLEVLAKFQEEAGFYKEAVETLTWLEDQPAAAAWKRRLKAALEEAARQQLSTPAVTPAESGAARP